MSSWCTYSGLAMAAQVVRAVVADPEEEADSSFQAFDVDADGRVGAEDLRVAAASLGIELDAAACAEMLEEVAAKPERGASREEFCAAALQG